MHIPPEKKNKLVKLFPELGEYFDRQETNEALKSIASNSSMPPELLAKIKAVKGDKGDKGDKGEAFVGSKGEKGDKGDKGDPGEKGAAFIGSRGPKGDKGDPGVDGRDGRDGKDGKDGRNGLNGKDVPLNKLKELTEGMAKIDGRIKLVDQRFHGAGLSKVSTDATLTGLGTPASPLSVIGGGSGITSLNTLTGAIQTFATGTSGSDFGVSSSGTTHTFNIPSAGTSARGLVTTASQAFSGNKQFNDGIGVSVLKALADGTTAIQITKADGTSSVVNVDTTNSRLGIGTTAPGATLQVGSDAQSTAGDGTIRSGASNGSGAYMSWDFGTNATQGYFFFIKNRDRSTPDVSISYLTGAVGFGNSNPSALLTLGTAGATAGSLSLAGATTGTTTLVVPATAGGTTTLPVFDGTLSSVVDTVSATGQTADITATNFTHGNVAGLYKISYFVQVSTGDGTAGTVQLQIVFPTLQGTTTFNAGSAVSLVTAGNGTGGGFLVPLNSGNIQYKTIHTGSYGSAAYFVKLVLERLS